MARPRIYQPETLCELRNQIARGRAVPTTWLNHMLIQGATWAELEAFRAERHTEQFSTWRGIRQHLEWCADHGWIFNVGRGGIAAFASARNEEAIIAVVGVAAEGTPPTPRMDARVTRTPANKEEDTAQQADGEASAGRPRSEHTDTKAEVRTPRTLLPLLPEEIDEQAALIEGATRKILVNAYERNRYAREVCIAHYGYTCAACGATLRDMYGNTAYDCIHVHHLRQLSELRASYEVDPIKDLRPMCPNCHAVIHLRNPPYSISEVAEMIEQQSREKTGKK